MTGLSKDRLIQVLNDKTERHYDSIEGKANNDEDCDMNNLSLLDAHETIDLNSHGTSSLDSNSDYLIINDNNGSDSDISEKVSTIHHEVNTDQTISTLEPNNTDQTISMLQPNIDQTLIGQDIIGQDIIGQEIKSSKEASSRKVRVTCQPREEKKQQLDIDELHKLIDHGITPNMGEIPDNGKYRTKWFTSKEEFAGCLNPKGKAKDNIITKILDVNIKGSGANFLVEFAQPERLVERRSARIFRWIPYQVISRLRPRDLFVNFMRAYYIFRERKHALTKRLRKRNIDLQNILTKEVIAARSARNSRHAP